MAHACPLTGEGRVAGKRQNVVEEKVERQSNARFPPKVQQHLGVERHAPAGAVQRYKTSCVRYSPESTKRDAARENRFNNISKLRVAAVGATVGATGSSTSTYELQPWVPHKNSPRLLKYRAVGLGKPMHNALNDESNTNAVLHLSSYPCRLILDHLSGACLVRESSSPSSAAGVVFTAALDFEHNMKEPHAAHLPTPGFRGN